MANKGKVSKENPVRRKVRSSRKGSKRISYSSEYGSFPKLRIFFWLSAVIIAVSLFSMRWSVDIVTGDDPVRLQHGKEVYKFYASGGKDTSYHLVRTLGYKYPHLRYYGGGFEIIPAAINAWFKPPNEFRVRHLVANIFASFLILFTGLFAKELLSWRTGIFALWLTFLTPLVVGLSMFNGKDIPTALGFAIFGFFILRFLKKLPQIPIWNLIGLALGIAVATSVRIGGVLLVGYLFLVVGFTVLTQPNLRSIFLKLNSPGLALAGRLVLVSFFGMVGGLLFYPNFFKHPFTHLWDGLRMVNSFPQAITWLHDGELVKSTDMPFWYLFQEFCITLPVLIIGCIVIFPFIYMLGRQDLKKEYVLLLAFGALFPIFYIIINETPIYGRWRHVLFVYPFMIGMAATSLDYGLFLIRKNKILTVSILLIAGVYMGKTAYWIFKNNPYQLLYYNELIGGTHGAYLRYEMDDYSLAAKMSLRWLLNSEEFKSALNNKKPNQKVLIAANLVSLKSEYLYIPPEFKDKIRFISVGFKSGFSYTNWDFGIFSTVFVEPNVLRLAYPPKETIHTIQIDGVPISAIVKRVNRNDAIGVNYVRNKNYERGLPYLKNADQYDPNNFRIWYHLATAYFHMGQYEPAIEYVTKYAQLFPEDRNAADLKRILNQILGQ